MKTLRPLVTALLMSCAMVSTVNAQQAGPVTDTATVLATVDGTDITLAHLIALRDELPSDYDQVPAEQLYAALLEQLVIQTALVGLVDDSAMRVGLDLENQRRSTLASAALRQHGAAAVTDEAVDAAYKAQFLDMPLPLEYNASHILVETEDEAKALVGLLNGGADFAETAKESSIGPSAPRGGELGWFGRGQMVPEFDTAVAGMEVSSISSPVKTQFGWHVIRLNDSREVPPPPLETVAADIRRGLSNKAQDELVSQLKEKTATTFLDVTVDPAIISRIDLLQ